MSDEVGLIEMTTSVHWRDEFGRFAKAIGTAGESTAKESISRGASLAAQFAPKRSLMLAASITPFYIGAGQGGWTAGSGHAMPQEHGARPHPIGYPGQRLGNKESGWFGIGPVNHPGNPATHFMLRAYTIVKSEMVATLRRNAKK